MSEKQKRYLVTYNIWADGRVVLGPMLHDAERPCAYITGTDQLPTPKTLTLTADDHHISQKLVADHYWNRECKKCFHPNRGEAQKLKTPPGVE